MPLARQACHLSTIKQHVLPWANCNKHVPLRYSGRIKKVFYIWFKGERYMSKLYTRAIYHAPAYFSPFFHRHVCRSAVEITVEFHYRRGREARSVTDIIPHEKRSIFLRVSIFPRLFLVVQNILNYCNIILVQRLRTLFKPNVTSLSPYDYVAMAIYASIEFK